MFESAKIGHNIGKAAFPEAVPLLRAALLEAQGTYTWTRRFRCCY